jgi:arsenate reductase
LSPGPEAGKVERMLKLYVYAKCSTCQKALKFLKAEGIPYREIPIRETPPPVPELKQVLQAQGGNLRKIFNTSGLDYKALGLKDKLPGMSEGEALDLLSSNGNLVKRPFAVGPGIGLAGFDPAAWKKAL